MTELETREQILHIAISLIAEKGFDKTSMNDIVRESGISKGGIYWHFKSKDEIIYAIVESIFAEQLQFLDGVLSGEGRAEERIYKLIDLISVSVEEMEGTMPSALDIYTQALRKPEILSHLKQYFEQYQAHFARLIEQGVQDGDFAVNNIERVAFTFISMIEGILLMQTLREPEQSLRDSLKDATELFLHGIQRKEGD